MVRRAGIGRRNPEIWKCSYCGAGFGSERGLVAHIAKKHISESKANGLASTGKFRSAGRKIKVPRKLNIDELKKERKLIEVFLAALEQDYIQGKVSLRSYEEAKRKNLARLGQIDAILEEFEKQHKDEKPKIKGKGVSELPRRKKEAAEDKPIGELIQEELQRELEEQKKEEEKKKRKERSEDSSITAESGETEKQENVAEVMSADEGEKRFPISAPKGIALPKLFGKRDAESEFLKKLDELNLSFSKQLEALKAEIEKISARVDTEKEARDALSQRFQTMAEEIGEMRAIVRQRELSLSKQEAEFEKIKELINEIKPEKVVAQFTKMEAEIVKNQSRIEKLETLMSDLIEKVKKIYDVLQNIGHIENLLELTKKMEEKKNRMEQIERNVNSISKKIEHTLVELNSKLENVDNLSKKLTTLEELTNSLSSSVEDLNKRLFDYAEKAETSLLREELADIKKEVSGLKESAEELRARILALQSRQSGMSDAASSNTLQTVTEATEDSTERLKKLQEEKNEIMMLLTMLEEEYKKGTLSEDEYLKAKKTNQIKLEEIESEIRRLTSPVVQPQQGVQELKKQESEKASPQQSKAENQASEQTDLPRSEEATESKEKYQEEVPSIQEKSSPEVSQSRKEDTRTRLLRDLEDMYKKGMISKDAYERTKKRILSMKV